MRIGVRRRRTWKPLIRQRPWLRRQRLSLPGEWAWRRRRRTDLHETKNAEEKAMKDQRPR